MTFPLTLPDIWQSFNDKVVHANASDIQRIEMRRAFHAGFICCWELLTDHVASLDKDEAIEFMNSRESEIMSYLSVMMNEAGIDLNQPGLFTADEGKPQ
jgi:hypothetical protein